MNTLDVEVFATGKWNGNEYKQDVLDSIVSAFSSLKEFHKVPIKFGHNDIQPMTDGQPALGWVDNVWVNGKTLMAKFVDIPDVVYEAIQKKLYKTVSIELDMGVEFKGSDYPYVLSGVALLGADIPAVNGLSDLQAYMERDSELTFTKRVFFSKDIQTDNNHEDKPMSDVIELKEKIKTLELEKIALTTERDRLVQENSDLGNEKIQLKAKFKAIEEADEGRRVKDDRSALEARLETMVKDAKITPFSRDDMLADYDAAGNVETRKSVVFAVDTLEKTIERNPAYFGAQQARDKQNRDKNESEKSAATIVTQRTREFMAKHGEKSFSMAKTAVLRADTELAERYTKLEA